MHQVDRRSKIIIAGPGRSGTTFLVQLLTRLGFDTGFVPYKEVFDKKARAGCEAQTPTLPKNWRRSKKRLQKEFSKLPKILKAPAYGFVLKGLVAEGVLKVEHVICPLRDLDQIAKSRVQSETTEWFTHINIEPVVEQQKFTSAAALGFLVEACVLLSIPLTITQFPQIVKHEDYCYKMLSGVFKINKRKFQKVFRELSNPELIKFG